MIIAAAYNSSQWYHNLSFNWFDVVVIAILGFGVWRGRKNGMSREVIPLCTWLLIVIVGGLCAPLLADLLVKSGIISKVFGGTFVAYTVAVIISYIFIAAVIVGAFSPLRTKFREKMTANNTFGSGEYYLGMISGLIRFACILLFFLALLNAPGYSAEEISAQKAYNARWYGGGQQGFSGDFFPSIPEIQADVFASSFSGRIIRENLAVILLHGSTLSKNSHH